MNCLENLSNLYTNYGISHNVNGDEISVTNFENLREPIPELSEFYENNKDCLSYTGSCKVLASGYSVNRVLKIVKINK